ncbi:hypothetical protein AK812_SmicGene6059 [Symbiodinium microadriaticum]|uniref:Uncharacterized protein n=1 Tax=Symbiodinium microadriaticum TaxID=2951 RepID=A0A1Q9ERX0_SYMMI|nr:hypothetical protein AK812_SmicGene6059 [Symbiodinium microadriaticum]
MQTPSEERLVALLDQWSLQWTWRGRQRAIGAGAYERYCTLGLYAFGGNAPNVSKASSMKEACIAVNRFMRHRFPHGTWTSIAVLLNPRIGLHRDMQNMVGKLNHAITLGTFNGGPRFGASSGRNREETKQPALSQTSFALAATHVMKKPAAKKYSNFSRELGTGFAQIRSEGIETRRHIDTGNDRVLQGVQVAKSLWHPFDTMVQLPDLLLKAIFEQLTLSPLELSKLRLERLSKWRQWSVELQQEEQQARAKMHPNVRKVLGQKRTVLLERIAESLNWPGGLTKVCATRCVLDSGWSAMPRLPTYLGQVESSDEEAEAVEDSGEVEDVHSSSGATGSFLRVDADRGTADPPEASQNSDSSSEDSSSEAGHEDAWVVGEDFRNPESKPAAWKPDTVMYRHVRTGVVHIMAAGSSEEIFTCGRPLTKDHVEVADVPFLELRKCKQCEEIGLSSAEIAAITGTGVNTLSKLAFATVPPGQSPSDAQVQGLFGEGAVTAGTMAAAKRLIFEAHTLVVQELKTRVQRGDTGAPSTLASAEREERIAEQRGRITGLLHRGVEEPSHASYDLVYAMLSSDSLTYLGPDRFPTRQSELQGKKPGKELTIDGNSVTVRDKVPHQTCATGTELELTQALRRRALAFDLVKCASYDVMNRYHSNLIHRLQELPPPTYSKISVAQVLRADRAAFTRIAESLASIKRKPDGALPLDKALDEIIQDPSVSFHLLPLKASEQDDRKRKVYDDPKKPDDANKWKKPFKDNKGKGKWKDKDKVGTKGAKFIKMPKQLVGKASETGDGKRLCWAYNIDGCPNAEDGEDLAPAVDQPQTYLAKVMERVKGISLDECLILEVSPGSGRLTACMKRFQLDNSFSIDRAAGKCCAPRIVADLSTDEGRKQFANVLSESNLIYVHFSPPCNTTSRARLHQFAGAPAILRTDSCPDGVPNLQPSDQLRVDAANAYLEAIAAACKECFDRGVLVSLSNPESSFIWTTKPMRRLLQQVPMFVTSFHLCSFASPFKKAMKILHTLPRTLGIRMLQLLQRELQPGGKAIKRMCQLSRLWLEDAGGRVVVDVGQGSLSFGVYHEPQEFVAKALLEQHPCHLESLLPAELVHAIRVNHSKGAAVLGQERTETLRKRVARASELSADEEQLKNSFSPHRQKILHSKRLLLMKEMLDSVGHEDEDLISDLSTGFDLTGPLPRSHVFKDKYRPAAMAEETLRKSARLVRGQVLSAVKSSGDEVVDQGVLAATEKELAKGFVEGPVPESCIPPDGTITHRFGVVQGHSDDGPKIRPIDNYLSSLVNAVVSQSEQVPVHTLDVVAGMLSLWLHMSPLKSLSDGLVCKCWDLSAAYEQIPLSDKSFEKDSLFVIFCPKLRKHVIYKQRVMPFGAKASVTAFIRCRLQLASGQLFGRRAKVALHQLSRHPGGRLGESSLEACRFLRDMISSNKSRVLSRQLGNTVHVYVDASFSDEGRICGIGGMVYDKAGTLLQWYGENLETAFVKSVMTGFEKNKETVIFELEALAVYAALKFFFKFLKGKNVVVFTDNEGVHGAFVKCWSVSKFASYLIREACEIEENKVGLSERRAKWIMDFILDAQNGRGMIEHRRFTEFVGRLVYAGQVLYWLRPFMGPLHRWKAAIHPGTVALMPRMVMVVLRYLLPFAFRTDAKAEDDFFVLGGSSFVHRICLASFFVSLQVFMMKCWNGEKGEKVEPPTCACPGTAAGAGAPAPAMRGLVEWRYLRLRAKGGDCVVHEYPEDAEVFKLDFGYRGQRLAAAASEVFAALLKARRDRGDLQELVLEQRGLCALCGTPIEPATEADHMPVHQAFRHCAWSLECHRFKTFLESSQATAWTSIVRCPKNALANAPFPRRTGAWAWSGASPIRPIVGPGWYGKPATAFMLDTGLASWADFEWSLHAAAHVSPNCLARALDIMERAWPQGEEHMAKLAVNALIGLSAPSKVFFDDQGHCHYDHVYATEKFVHTVEVLTRLNKRLEGEYQEPRLETEPPTEQEPWRHVEAEQVPLRDAVQVAREQFPRRGLLDTCLVISHAHRMAINEPTAELLRSTRPCHAITYASCQGLTLRGRVWLCDTLNPHFSVKHRNVGASRCTGAELLSVL